MAGLDMICCLPPMMAYPVRYATPENGWDRLFIPKLPSHLIIADRRIASGFWEGGFHLTDPAVWQAWLPPMLGWTAFVVAMGVLWIATTALFCPRWIESERLTFPVSQLPEAMTLHPRSMATSGAFGVALAAVFLLDAVNGMHFLQPLWPYLPVKCDASPVFNLGAQLIEPPWNAVGSLLLSFYPFAIGLGLLLPVRLSLSCWVFYLLIKAQHVVANQAGSWLGEGFPYTREQSLGAFFGLAAFSTYMSRRHIARFFREARLGTPAGDRPLSPRATLLCLGGSMLFLVAFGRWAGMTIPYSVGFFVIYAVLCLSFTRIRAEMGIPTHELHLVGPGQSLFRWLGSERIGSRNMAVSTVFYWFNRAYRGHPMPHIAEGFKLCERANMPQRSLVPWALAALVVGALASTWVILRDFYLDGAGAKWANFPHAEWIARVPYGELASVLSSPTRLSGGMIGASVIGSVVTVLTMAAHSYVSWWPLHPVGYAVSNGWAMDRMWYSIFTAWCVKAVVTRYAGSRGLERLRSFAFGLVLGDYTAGSLWAIYGTWKKTRFYSYWL